MFDKGFTDVPEKVAEINCPSSNVSMEVLTTEEGMLLYTAKYTSSSLQRMKVRNMVSTVPFVVRHIEYLMVLI